MKKPTSILAQILQIVGVLYALAALTAALISVLNGINSFTFIAIAAGCVGSAILFGVAEILDAVVRTAAAAEELVRIERGRLLPQ